MKCALPRCNKTVPPTSRTYCCRAHGVIGQINKVVEHDAKKVGKAVSLCAADGCNRLFREQEGVDKCYACRKNRNTTCKLDGCSNKIPVDRNATALFCCDKHYRIQKSINKKKRTKKSKVAVLCDVKDCGNMYIKTSNAQKFCPECRKAGGAYDPEKGRFVFNKRRNERKEQPISSPGKMHHDHREKICRKDGKLCGGYSECLEPRNMGGNKGWKIVMKYEKNGGIDCYYRTKGINRANYGDSFGVCSENY